MPVRILCVIGIYTDEGVCGFRTNYGGGVFACAVIEQRLKRFHSASSSARPPYIRRATETRTASALPRMTKP
jgi:hypothetical protein